MIEIGFCNIDDEDESEELVSDVSPEELGDDMSTSKDTKMEDVD